MGSDNSSFEQIMRDQEWSDEIVSLDRNTHLNGRGPRDFSPAEDSDSFEPPTPPALTTLLYGRPMLWLCCLIAVLLSILSAGYPLMEPTSLILSATLGVGASVVVDKGSADDSV